MNRPPSPLAGLELAWRELQHRRRRTITALLGVAFAIILIFMQIGFYRACEASATRIHGLLDFDLLLTSARYSFIVESDSIDAARLEQARAVAGVADTVAVRSAPTLWRTPDGSNRYDMLILGVDPADRPFQPAAVNQSLLNLRHADSVIFDQRSHPVLGENVIGTTTEVENHRLRVVDEFHWGAGFSVLGLAITDRRTFARVFQRQPRNRLQLGLVRLKPEADVELVAARLRQVLDRDVRVWTRDEIESKDRRFFLSERPIGLMFQSGVALALIVGGVIFFQILASQITQQRAELATLRALGFSRLQVFRTITAQGFLYTLAAFLLAWPAAAALYEITRQIARLPMSLDLGLVFSVFGLSLLMSLVGAWVAGHKLRSADPADLF